MGPQPYRSLPARKIKSRSGGPDPLDEPSLLERVGVIPSLRKHLQDLRGRHTLFFCRAAIDLDHPLGFLWAALKDPVEGVVDLPFGPLHIDLDETEPFDLVRAKDFGQRRDPIVHFYETFLAAYDPKLRELRGVYYTPEPVVYHWESITSDGSPAIPNRYIIIKHGMLFKQRWRHMFEKEDGPSDAETKWKVIEMPSLEGPRRPLGR